jgi:hypothetical protein
MVDLKGSDLNLLASLDILIEEANVTRAAARLNISQPALSAQLARLRHLFLDPLLVPSKIWSRDDSDRTGAGAERASSGGP